MAGPARARSQPGEEPTNTPQAVNERPTTIVGVLALQGSVGPHVDRLRDLSYDPRLVRRPEQLSGLTHLILPGGESTTFHNLMDRFGLWDPLRTAGEQGRLALFGTCAGAIVLGRKSEERPPRMGLIDVAVDRNAYGRQVDSFETPLELAPPLGSLAGVFIRAPKLVDPGPAVEILGTHEGNPIVARQDRILVATFHPELSTSTKIHEYFLGM